MKLRMILALSLALALTTHAGTNTLYRFDDTTGNILTQLVIMPPLFKIAPGYFFDGDGGNYCVLQPKTNAVGYRITTNVVWGGSNQYTNLVSATLFSNVITLGRVLVGGSNQVSQVTNATPYRACTNVVWGGENQFTNVVCGTAFSNIVRAVTNFYRGAYPITNRAAAVINGP